MVWPTGKKYEVNLRIDRRPGAETNHEHLDGGESMEKIWPLLFAALAGAAMALQGTMNSALSKTVGLLQATFFVHVLGALVALIAMLTFGKTSSLMRLGSAPPLSWFGGALGVLIIVGVAVSMPKVGVGKATTAIVATQLLAAFLIDHFGLLGMRTVPFQLMKLAGGSMIVVGAWIILRR